MRSSIVLQVEDKRPPPGTHTTRRLWQASGTKVCRWSALASCAVRVVLQVQAAQAFTSTLAVTGASRLTGQGQLGHVPYPASRGRPSGSSGHGSSAAAPGCSPSGR